MAKRKDREAVDDLEDELVRALRRWCRRPSDEATRKLQDGLTAFRRTFMASSEAPLKVELPEREGEPRLKVA